MIEKEVIADLFVNSKKIFLLSQHNAIQHAATQDRHRHSTSKERPCGIDDQERDDCSFSA